MTTQNQNRANRKDAISHGILSKEVVLPGEDRLKLYRLRKRLLAEPQPVGELETIVVEHIIASTF